MGEIRGVATPPRDQQSRQHPQNVSWSGTGSGRLPSSLCSGGTGVFRVQMVFALKSRGYDNRAWATLATPVCSFHRVCLHILWNSVMGLGEKQHKYNRILFPVTRIA